MSTSCDDSFFRLFAVRKKFNEINYLEAFIASKQAAAFMGHFIAYSYDEILIFKTSKKAKTDFSV